MKDRLTDQEIRILQSLEMTRGPADAELVRQASDRMYRHGLIATDSQEGVQITGRGKHLLFQRRCINLLRSVQEGKMPLLDQDAAKWLEKNGFIRADDAQAVSPIYSATRRANAWLDALELE